MAQLVGRNGRAKAGLVLACASLLVLTVAVDLDGDGRVSRVSRITGRSSS